MSIIKSVGRVGAHQMLVQNRLGGLRFVEESHCCLPLKWTAIRRSVAARRQFAPGVGDDLSSRVLEQLDLVGIEFQFLFGGNRVRIDTSFFGVAKVGQMIATSHPCVSRCFSRARVESSLPSASQAAPKRLWAESNSPSIGLGVAEKGSLLRRRGQSVV